jgi:hypothetical protein
MVKREKSAVNIVTKYQNEKEELKNELTHF